MNQPEFPTVFRGYDPVQVDAVVSKPARVTELREVIKRFTEKVKQN